MPLRSIRLNQRRLTWHPTGLRRTITMTSSLTSGRMSGPPSWYFRPSVHNGAQVWAVRPGWITTYSPG
nr:MAG TPA: hypothetical protein [Caudoviricetes sp.]